ncbi:gamma-glutamyl-gamma-aminobutyrate hydrolase family protein [Roseateles sp. BYS180W]|uniref:Gamma-glutamyl-gamma-aminobutyrate hydrolase family protein n=1 Tax=Roseateles rivi TaxID=3299028 RepID=A0ABW7FZF0_9BURK
MKLPEASAPTERKPVVLIPSCNRMVGEHPFHIAGQKYVQAVRLAGCLPLIAPPTDAHSLPELLALADGVLLSGSPSNVHPDHFGEAVLDPTLPLDPERDALTLPLVRAAVAMGLPLLAICRGLQETNVALGGSLHQAVQEQEGMADHRAPPGQPPQVAYAEQHEVEIQAGGRLAALFGAGQRVAVNSLHGQGVKTLAPGLHIEALAPDGLVEAFSVRNASGYTLCLQWHPEWLAEQNPVSMAMLRDFGAACQAYRARRALGLSPLSNPKVMHAQPQ